MCWLWFVHAKRLELIDNQFSLAMNAGKRGSEIVTTRQKVASISVRPLCFATSDHWDILFFVNGFADHCQRLLETARNATSGQGLFLDSNFDD